MQDYNEQMQEFLVQLMITDPSIFVRANPILNPIYFTSKKFASVVKFIQDYSKEYGALPTLDEVKARTTVQLTKIDDFSPNHAQAALDTVEEFCKQRGAEVAVLKAAEMLQKGKRDGVQKIIKEASLISLQRDLGTDYFKDPKSRLDLLNQALAAVSTGWTTVDKLLNGGFGWGELEIFLAPSGGGKSVTLANQALTQVQNGHDVLYITLELKEELVAQRIDAMLTDIPIWEIKRQVDNTALMVVDFKRKNPKSGNLFIKYMRADVTSANSIEAYLNELEVQTGIRPQVIIIDYLDLLRPNDKRIAMDNLSLKDKMIAQEVRSLAADRTARGFNTITCTASQINRQGLDELEFNMSSIAGGLTKVYVADNVIAASATKPMRDREEIQFQFLKTRNSGGVGMKVMLRYNQKTLRITDMEDQNSSLNESPALKFMNRKKAESTSDNTAAEPPTGLSAATSSEPGPSTGASALRDLLNRNRGLKS